jgi:hypothetical protein
MALSLANQDAQAAQKAAILQQLSAFNPHIHPSIHPIHTTTSPENVKPLNHNLSRRLHLIRHRVLQQQTRTMTHLGRAGSRQESDLSISYNDLSTRPALSPLAIPFIPVHLHQTTIPPIHDTHATSPWGDIIDHSTSHCRIAFQNINRLQDKSYLISRQISALGHTKPNYQQQ